VTLCASLILSTLITRTTCAARASYAPEVHALCLLAVIGATVMAMATT
jgi:hypothetical protein